MQKTSILFFDGALKGNPRQQVQQQSFWIPVGKKNCIANGGCGKLQTIKKKLLLFTKVYYKFIF